jgi:predicted kinase
MAKVILMKGLPGSGKSTHAKELMRGGGNFYRVNRDHLREMLYFTEFRGNRERMVIDIEQQIVQKLLLDYGSNVIVDDCNLGQKHHDMWKNFLEGEQFSALRPINLETKFVDTPLEECIERDRRRDRSVGRSVIVGMAMQYELYKPEKVVICDIDGTIADLAHRRHYVHKDCPSCDGNGIDGQVCAKNKGDIHSADVVKHPMDKDWKSFFAELPADTVITSTAQQLWQKINQGCTVFYVSARPEDHRKATEEWLKRVGAPNYKALFMRRAGDKRDDDLIKEELLNKYFPNKAVIDTVFDDRPRVIRMWRKNGLQVVDCGDGREF